MDGVVITQKSPRSVWWNSMLRHNSVQIHSLASNTRSECLDKFEESFASRENPENSVVNVTLTPYGIPSWDPLGLQSVGGYLRRVGYVYGPGN